MGNHHGSQFGPNPPQLKRATSRNKIVLHENLPILCQFLTEKSKKDNVGENISRRAFVNYFTAGKDKFGEILYEHYVSQQPSLDVHYVTKETFIRVSEEALELKSDANQLKYCTKVFARGKDFLTRQGIENLIQSCYLLASTVSNCADVCDLSSPGAKGLIDSLISSLLKTHDAVPLDSVCTWIKKNCPNLIFGVHHWVSQKLVSVRPVELEPDNFERDLTTPQLKTIPKDSSSLLNPVLLWILTCSLPVGFTKPKQTRPSLQRMLSGNLDPHVFIARLLSCSTGTRWTSLYNSNEHGHSFNRFQNQVFSYRGPTAVLLRIEEERSFCIAVDEEWREASHKWGGDNCNVVQVTPEYKIMESGPKMMYMNMNTRGCVHGIQVGQNCKNPLIEIEQEMLVVHVRKIPYKLLSIEVWGCGGEDTYEAQVKQKRWENREAERLHKVNLNAVDWKDNPDKYLLELGSSRSSYNQHS